MTTQQRQTLSDRQLRQFHEEGYLVARGLFSPEEMDTLRDTFMQQAKDGPVQGLSEGSRPNDKRSYAPGDPLARYPRMMHPHRHPDLPVGPLSRRTMLDPRLYGNLHDLFGEEPLAAQSMFYFKPPGARGQDYHQDNFYLKVKPGTCIAAWVAVDDADQSNGGLTVVPRSNNMDIVCPEPADSTLYFTNHHVPLPDGLHYQPVDLKAGDCLFFNGSLIHGSPPNNSDRFRRAFICHYVPERTSELARFYNAIRFSGESMEIAPAVGGGPCGELNGPTAPH